VQEYVLVNTTHQAVEIFRRAEPRWTYQRYGADETIALESIAVSLEVGQLYRRTDVPRTRLPKLPHAANQSE
jgi:hypothetical protein